MDGLAHARVRGPLATRRVEMCRTHEGIRSVEVDIFFVLIFENLIHDESKLEEQEMYEFVSFEIV